jgi:hypothetical protein
VQNINFTWNPKHNCRCKIILFLLFSFFLLNRNDNNKEGYCYSTYSAMTIPYTILPYHEAGVSHEAIDSANSHGMLPFPLAITSYVRSTTRHASNTSAISCVFQSYLNSVFYRFRSNLTKIVTKDLFFENLKRKNLFFRKITLHIKLIHK